MNASHQSNTSARKSKIMNETRNITHSINGSIDHSRGGTASQDQSLQQSYSTDKNQDRSLRANQRSKIDDSKVSRMNSSSKASGSQETGSGIDQQNTELDRSANQSSRSMLNQSKNISGGQSKPDTGTGSQETRFSFVGSSQETRSPGTAVTGAGRKRRGDRPHLAANTDDFDMSDFENVEPLPVINNDSVPSFLQGEFLRHHLFIFRTQTISKDSKIVYVMILVI